MKHQDQLLHLLEWTALGPRSKLHVSRKTIDKAEAAGLIRFKGVSEDGKAVFDITQDGSEMLQRMLVDLLT